MKRGGLWPAGVALILAATVGGNIWLYRVAKDDDSFAIEPNYYAKAVAWDSTMAQAQRNGAIGWHLQSTLGAFSRNGALLRVSLTDSLGRAVSDATITVDAMYNARAAQVVRATLSPDGGGYAARLPVRHGGQWELRFDVVRGGERFTASARVEARPGTGP